LEPLWNLKVSTMPKHVPPLSAKALAAVRPGSDPIELVDGHVPGLRVRVYPSGARAWSLNIRDATGTRRRFDVGSDIGLAEARRKAEELRRSIRQGADPTTERRAARQRTQAAREGVGTLGAVFDTYYSKGPGRGQKRADDSLDVLKAVFASLLDKPALDVKQVELQRAADDWRSPATASLAVRVVRPVLKWAERRGRITKGTHDLETVSKVGKRDRVLTRDEIKAIWPHLRGQHGAVMRWLAWTACRRDEAAGMTWGEIKGDIWTIPKERAKNGSARSIPLPRQAVEALGARGALTALVFPSKRGGVLSNWDRVGKQLQAASGTEDWHRHDIRRTAATLLGDLGFAPHVVAAVLGHADLTAGTGMEQVKLTGGATGIYLKSRYAQEHRLALQALADELDAINGVAQPAGAKIIQLGGAR
jgi:integrase